MPTPAACWKWISITRPQTGHERPTVRTNRGSNFCRRRSKSERQYNFPWLDAESCMFTLRTWFFTLMSSCGTAPHTKTISKTSWPNAREGHMVVGGRVCTLPCGHCLILRLLSCKMQTPSRTIIWLWLVSGLSKCKSVVRVRKRAHCEGPALMALLAAATCDQLYSLLRHTSKGSRSREKRKNMRKNGSNFNIS